MPTLQLHELTWGRGGCALAPAATLRLDAGEALVVTGPNGSGKSTLLRTLAGLLPPVSGRASMEKHRDAAGEVEARIGRAAHYLGHRNALKAARRVGDELGFWSRSGGLSAGQALAAVDLAHLHDLPCRTLSAGQARRVAIARLLVAPRPVWLLDEPSAALDAAATRQLADLCRAHLSGGGLVVAATHMPLDIGAPRELALLPAARPAPGAAGESWSEW